MKTIVSALFVAFIFSTVATANEEYVCNFGDNKRLISVNYENEQEQVPCQVKYDKGLGIETLWNAQSEVGYCESKAAEFVAKQESWGWSCSKVTQAEYVEKTHESVEDKEVQAALEPDLEPPFEQ